MNFNCLSIAQLTNVVKVTNLQKNKSQNKHNILCVTKSPEIVVNMNDSIYTICSWHFKLSALKLTLVLSKTQLG